MQVEHVDPAFDSSTNVNDPKIATLRNQLIFWLKVIAVKMVAMRKLGRISQLLYPFVRKALGAISNESQADAKELTRLCAKADLLDQLAEYLQNEETTQEGQESTEKSLSETTLKQIEEQEITEEMVEACVAQGAGIATPEALRAELGDSAFCLQSLILAGLKNVAVTSNRAIVMGEPSRQKLVFTAGALEDRINGLSKRKHADKELRKELEPQLAELQARIEEWRSKELAAIDLIVNALAVLQEAGANLEQLGDAMLAVGQAAKLAYELAEFGAVHTFGDPTPAPVRINPLAGECVAFCGDDFEILAQLLEIAEFYNVNVWTYGSAMAAHMYPQLAKSRRLVGHLSSPRYLQNKTLGAFPGATLVTSSTFDKPASDYADYVYTTFDSGWDKVHRLERNADGKYDFTDLIHGAKDSGGIFRNERAAIKLPVGFGGSTLHGVVNKIVEAYRAGIIKRIFAIGGEDSPVQGSDYYAKFYAAAPKTAEFVVFGDVRHRFEIADPEQVVNPELGLPRILDMGRISDVNAVFRFAEEVNRELGRTPANSPVAFRVSLWSERSVAAFLAICAQGYRDVAIGEYVPELWNDEIAETLKNKLNVRLIGDPAEDSAI